MTTKNRILTTFFGGQLFVVNTSQANEGTHWSDTIQGIFNRTNEAAVSNGVGIEIGFDVLTFLALTITFFGFFVSAMKDRNLQRNRDIKSVNDIIGKCIKDVDDCHQSNKDKTNKILIFNKVSTILKLEVDNALNFSLTQEHIQNIHIQVKEISDLILRLRDYIYSSTVSAVLEAASGHKAGAASVKELDKNKTKTTVDLGTNEEKLTSELLFKLYRLNTFIKQLNVNIDFINTYDCRLDNRDQFIINVKLKLTHYGVIFTQTLQSYNLRLFAICLIFFSISYYGNNDFYQNTQNFIQIDRFSENPNEIFYTAIALLVIIWFIFSYIAKLLVKHQGSILLLGFGGGIVSALLNIESIVLSIFVVSVVIFVSIFLNRTNQKQKRNKVEKVFCLNNVITEREIYIDRDSGEYTKVAYNKKGDTVEAILPHLFGTLFGEAIHFYTKDNLTKTKAKTIDQDVLRREEVDSKNQLLPFLEHLRNEDKLGSIRDRIHYIADLRHGIAETYREDTTLDTQLEYKLGIKDGQYVEYHPDGKQPKLACNYINNKRQGDYIEYHKNGKRKRKATYKDGQLSGDVITYNQNGVRDKVKQTCKNGLLTEYFLDTDKIKSETYFDASDHVYGFVNIIKKSYYPDLYLDGTRRRKRITKYKEGKKDGKCREYHDNGQLKFSREYVDGKRHCLETAEKQWRKDGSKISEIFYKDGEKDGESTLFHEDGVSIKETSKYIKGRILEGSKKINQVEDIGDYYKIIRSVFSHNKDLIAKTFDRLKQRVDYSGTKENFYEDNKTLKSSTDYVNGKEHGQKRRWREDGTIQSEVMYKDGQKDGTLTFYYEDGETVTGTVNYVNGEKHGSSEQYYNNSQLKLRIEHVNDKPNGQQRQWREDGTIQSEVMYKDGKKDGALTFYYKGGETIRTTIEYTKGVQVGGQTEYYNDKNNPKKMKEYKKSDGSSLERKWRKDGTKKSEVNYLRNKKNGESITYFEDGKNIKKIIEYKENEKQFVKEYYKDSETLRIKELYKNDKLSVVTGYYQNGQEEYVLKYKEGIRNGLEEQWYENGQKFNETKWKHGNQHGEEIWWYLNGEKSSNVEYDNDKQQGLATYWYENGQMKTKSYYRNNKEDGLTEWWHSNGSKWVENNLKDGKKEGRRTFWDKDGTLKFSGNYKDGKPIKKTLNGLEPIFIGTTLDVDYYIKWKNGENIMRVNRKEASH